MPGQRCGLETYRPDSTVRAASSRPLRCVVHDSNDRTAQRIMSPLPCSRTIRYYLRIRVRTSEDLSLPCRISCRIMTAAASPYRRVRASTEQASNGDRSRPLRPRPNNAVRNCRPAPAISSLCVIRAEDCDPGARLSRRCRGHDDETGARSLSRFGRLPEQTQHEKSCSADASAAANAGCRSLRSMRTWARFSRARSAFTNDTWLIADTQAAIATGWDKPRRSGLTAQPSGSSSPPSSNTMTPLHSRLQPCLG
jgi:hypothetical protein